MRISFIVAMSENHVIGIDGHLPWHLPNDLKHFKELTLNKAVLMGRKTFQSLKKPLPHRLNIVLTSNREFMAPPHVLVMHNKEEVYKRFFLSELIVIGGEEVFKLFLSDCDRIFLTLVHTKVLGDTFFPSISDFVVHHSTFHDADDRHAYSYSFIEYRRNVGEELTK